MTRDYVAEQTNPTRFRVKIRMVDRSRFPGNSANERYRTGVCTVQPSIYGDLLSSVLLLNLRVSLNFDKSNTQNSSDLSTRCSNPSRVTMTPLSLESARRAASHSVVRVTDYDFVTKSKKISHGNSKHMT